MKFPKFLWSGFLGTALLLAAIMPAPLFSQAGSDDTVPPAVITFTLDFPHSDPEHYSIEVHSNAHAKYACMARISQDSDEREPYDFDFEFSPATRARIFALAMQAQYFAGKVDTGNRKLAFTGAKKLTYNNGQHNYSADYNYSNVPAVQQLTALFQGVAATLEFGRRLAYYHHYQKLALDEELKHMENQANHNELSELQAVQSVLQAIVDDASVMNVVRGRAQKLIELGKNGPAASR